MKATSLTRGRPQLVDLPAPRPKAGQFLLDVKRCGICGSDLHSRLHGDDLADALELCGYPHSRLHGDDLADALELCGYPRYMRSHQDVVMGHEIYGEVAEHGPSSSSRVHQWSPSL
ncbi:hypothetical protein [Streptomyces sp. NPDC095817]|uniref:alcohol dehydrogenase catalytic domain-containing protein n=1 Tax=Streptomyces sp. NPDC095817 TaxID=3155082 RepID=UPI00332C8158